MNTETRQHHTIDAEGRVLGRLATEVAQLLRGKGKVDFQPHIDNGDFVNIKNVDKLVVTGKKMEQKIYYSHSEYPGGLKEVQMKRLFEKNPSEVLKKAVWNMLPKNKLRARYITRLKFVK